MQFTQKKDLIYSQIAILFNNNCHEIDSSDLILDTTLLLPAPHPARTVDCQNLIQFYNCGIIHQHYH